MRSTFTQNSAKFSKTFRFFVLLAAFIAITISNLYAQSVSNYIVTRATGATYTPLSGSAKFFNTGGWRNGTNKDDNLSRDSLIGFDFYYNGTRYTRFQLSTEGFLNLNTATTATGSGTGAYGYAPVQMFRPNGSNAIIAPLYDDLSVPTLGNLTGPLSTIKWETTGSSPNRIFTAQWANMQRRSAAAGIQDATLNFQIKLFEADGHIEFVYGTMTLRATNPANFLYASGINAQVVSTTPTVDELLVQQTVNTDIFNNTVPSFHSVLPASNSRIIFTPEIGIPTAPITFSATAISQTSMNVNWVDNSTTETFFSVRRSLSAGGPFVQVGTVLSTSKAGTGVIYSFSNTGLLPSTTYYYQITANNEGRPPSPNLLGNATTLPPGIKFSTASGGLWSAPSTWLGGVVPIATDEVTIVDGATVTIDVAAVAFIVNLEDGFGILQYEATTARSLTVAGDINIGVDATFRSAATGTVTTHSLVIGRSLFNNGTLDFSTNGNSAGARIIFNNPNDAVFSTANVSSTDLRSVGGITVNKSSPTSNFKFVENGAPGAFTVEGGTTLGFLTLTQGIFEFAENTLPVKSFPLFTLPNYTIPSTATFWMNNQYGVVLGQNGNATNFGTILMTSGIYNVGTVPNNTLTGTGGKYIISGGAFNIGSRLQSTGIGSFIMDKGTVNITTIPLGNSGSFLPGFDFSATTLVDITGGTINLVQASTGATPLDFRISSTAVNITGGILNVGTAATATNFNFRISGVTPTIDITSATNAKTATLAANTSVFGDVTIQTGSTLNLNAFTLFHRGTQLLNSGTLNGSTLGSTLHFLNTKPQTWTGTGANTGALQTLNMENTAGLTISPTLTQCPILRANLFQGVITNSNRLTMGTSPAVENVVVQIGATGITTAGGSFANAPLISSPDLNDTYSIIYAQEGLLRITGFEIPASRSVTNVTINNLNGVTLSGGNLSISSSGLLTLTNGKFTTDAVSKLAITNTSVGAIITPSASSYVSGPMSRVLPSSLGLGQTYIFPVGKSGYIPLEYVNPTTNALGTVTIETEAFDLFSGGTPGTSIGELNTNRYWFSSVVSGSANFTGSQIRLTDANLGTADAVAASLTKTGAYNLQGGLTATVTSSSVTTTAPPITSFSNFYQLGSKSATVLSALAINPTGSLCVSTPRTITITATPSGSAVTDVAINYFVNGVAQTAIAMTNTSGNNWSGVIPVVTPANATVTWSVTATNANSFTKTVQGTAYSDDPLFTVSVVASASPAILCSGSPVTLTGVISGGSQPATYLGFPTVSSPLTDEDIVNVTISQGASVILNNTSVINTLSGTIGTATGTAGSYSDFTTFGSYSLIAGSTYDFSVQVDDVTPATLFNNRVVIYLDLNRNGLFTDAGEQIYQQNPSVSGPQTVNASILIPASAFNGITRMRIFSIETSFNVASPNPFVSDGEFEEYSINIISPNNGGGTPPVVTAFSWSDGVSVVGSTNPLTLSPTTTTTYTLTITSLGCTKSATPVVVTVNPVPSAPTTTNSGHCGTQIPTASVTSTSGLGSPIFKWYTAATGGTLLQTNTSTTYLTAISATQTFYVSEANAGGCESSTRTAVTVTVITPDALTATSSAVSGVCVNSTITLTPTKVGSTQNYSLVWTATPLAGSGLAGPVAGTLNVALNVTPTAPGTYLYRITGTDAGCVAVSTVSVVVVDPFAGVTFTTSAFPDPVCAGTSTNLSVTLTGGPIPPTYSASSATSIFDEDIGNITITQGAATILNNSTPVSSLTGTIGVATGTAARYSNFTAFGPYGLVANGAYNFSITSVQTDTDFPHGFGIYIDYNRNGSFTDAGEEIYNSPTFISGVHTATGSFTVPAGAFNGSTRMRIITSESTISGSTTSFSFGEVEDYTILISGGATGGGSSQAPTSFSWFDGVSVVSTSNPATVTPLANTTYTVTVGIGACTNSSATIVVNPTIITGNIISGTPSVCAGSPGTIQIAVTGPGPWVGQLTGGIPFSGSVSPITATVNPLVNTTYFITNLVGLGGCAALPGNRTGSATINVNAIPTVTISGTLTVCPTGTTLLTANALAGSGTITGYQWIRNGTDIPGATASTYSALGADVGSSYTVRVTNSNTCIRVSTAVITTIQQVTVTASSAGNGGISPAGATITNCESGSIVYTFTPNSCYRAVDALLNGVTAPGFIIGSTNYTLTNVSTNSTFQVVYGLIPYTISINPAINNGSINFVGGPIVDCGGTKTVNIVPDVCYEIVNVFVNGSPIGPVTTYAFNNVTANQTISATFQATKYPIVSSVNGGGGTISPLGLDSVVCNNNQVYTITPNGGFAILNVVVDGVSVGNPATYTFTNVTAPHTIEVFFNDVSCLFPPSANAGVTDTICKNEVFTLGGSITNTTVATWFTSGTGSFNGGSVYGVATTYTPSAADLTAGFVTITLTTDDPDGAGSCVAASSSFILRFNNIPTANITGTLNYCIGSNTVLSSNALAGSGSIVLYEWFLGVAPVGGNTSNLAASAAGSYTVRVTNSNGCVITSAPVSVVTNVNPTVTIAVSCNPFFPGNTVNFTTSTTLGSGASITYQWFLNASPIGGATASTYATTVAGTYTCIVTSNQGSACATTSNAIILNNITGSLSGTYTVGTPSCSNFNTLALAVSYLNNNGVSGAVIIDVADAYTETAPTGGYSLGSAILNPTLTAVNTLTIKKAGAGANPVLTAYTGGTGTTNSTTPDGIFRLVGTDYVTINGINLIENYVSNLNNAQYMEFGYGLFKLTNEDGAQNNTIRNSTISLNRNNFLLPVAPQTEGSAGILIINATPTAATTSLVPTLASGSNSFNKIYSNTIQNCNIGVSISGYNAPSPYTLGDSGNDIGGSSLATGNTIINFGGGTVANQPSAGINLIQQWSVNASFNTINSNTGAGFSHPFTLRGIYGVSGTDANATFNSNTISLACSGNGVPEIGIDVGLGGVGTTNIVSISNNTINNFTHTAATPSTNIAGINLSVTPAQVNINSNTISGFSILNNGPITLIQTVGINGPLSSSSTVNSNTIQSISKTGTLGNIRGIFLGITNGVQVNTNTVENISFTNAANTGTVDGIINASTSIGGSMSNNIVRNLSTPLGTIRGIVDQATSGTKTINNNQVYNLTTAPAATSTGAVTGISIFGGTVDFSNNQIYGFNRTAGNILGLSIGGSTVQIGNIARNRIYDLLSSGTTATVFGVSVTNSVAGTINTIHNNLIGNLSATATTNGNAVIGINNLSSLLNTMDLSYNTIYLNATSSGSGYGSSAVSVAVAPSVIMKNNILVNKSAPTGVGRTVVYRRANTTLTTYSTESDNNLLYGGTPGVNNLIYSDGTVFNQTITTFQSTMITRDQTSVTEDVAFTSLVGSNAGFLHVNTAISTAAESGGKLISALTTDFDGNIRQGSGGYVGTGTAPDIGADEFAGTNPSPIISNVIITPAGNRCASTARVITANITNGPITIANLNYRINGGANNTLSMGTGPYSATIPIVTPSNALITWTIVATNSLGRTTTFSGTSYQDNPNGTFTAVAAFAFASACQSSSLTITGTLTNTALAPSYALSPAPTTATALTLEDVVNVNFGAQLNNTSTYNQLNSTLGTATGVIGRNSDFTAFFSGLNYIAGTSYPLSISVENQTDNQSNGIGAFIDYNRNGVFSDPGEFVYASTLGTGTRTVLTNITIPNSALPGRTRMRIIVKGGSLVTTALEGLPSGETEDYLIEILPSFTYVWRNGANTVVGTSLDLSITATTSDTYTLTATDQNGCQVVTNSYALTVNPIGTFTNNNGLGDNNWNTATNWCGNVVPTTATNVVLPTSTNPFVLGTDITANTVIISTGAQLNVPVSRTLTISSGGSITNNSATPSIGLGTVIFAGAGTVTGNTTFANVTINGGLTLPTGININGTFRINSNGFVAGNSPSYGVGSLLLYNSVGNFNRSLEWGAASGPGYPYDVQISNNTQVNLGSNSAAGKTINNATQRNLTIDGGGSALYMDFGTREMNVPLQVNGDLLINGFMSLSNQSGGDLRLRGNLTLNGTWSTYNRAVIFINNGAQTITSSSPPLFIPYAIFAPVSGSTTVIMGSDVWVSGNNGGAGFQFSNVGDRWNLNGRFLRLGDFAQPSNLSGGGAFIGSPTSDIEIRGNGTGSTVSLRMDQTNRATRSLSRFIVNRTSPTSVQLADSVRIVANDLVSGSGTVELINGTVNTGNRLVLGSTALGTARIAAFNTAIADISGQIIAERFTTGISRRYRHLSSPVNEGAGTITFNQLIDDIHVTGVGGTLNGFDVGGGGNRPSAFMYDEVVDDNLATIADQQRGYIGVSNITNTISTGRGMLALVRGPRATQSSPFSGFSIPDPTTLDFVGQTNKGNINIPVTYTLHVGTTGPGGQNFAQIDGFNLVGNPYPSQINPASAFTSNANLSKVVQSYNTTTGSYEFYDYSTGIGSSNSSPYLGSGQGFLVQTIASTNIALTESMKVPNSPPGFLFKSASVPNLLRVKMIKDSTNSDESVIVFGNGSHSYYEPSNDALKFFGSSLNLSTKSSDGLQLSINRYPIVVLNDTIPMPISSTFQTSHDFKFSGLDSFDPTLNIYLLDQFLGTTTLVSNNIVHSFTITSNPLSQGAERFKLIFDNQAPLPVRLISFNGKKNEMTSLLTWKTAAISGKPLFEVERSLDGKNFEQIGSVKSNGGSIYDFTDLNPEKAINYYRLKIVDANGKSELSRVVAIDFSEAAKTRMTVYPNPFTDQVTLRLAGELQDSYLLNVTDNFGRKLVSNKMMINSNEISVSLAEIAVGVYTIELLDAVTGNLIAREKIVKQ